MYYGRRFDYLFMAVLPISRRTGSRWIWSSLCVYPVESPSINIRFNSLVRLSTESLLRSSDRWNWLCRLDPQPVSTHQADSPHAPFVQFCEHLTPDQGAPHVFVGAPPTFHGTCLHRSSSTEKASVSTLHLRWIFMYSQSLKANM